MKHKLSFVFIFFIICFCNNIFAQNNIPNTKMIENFSGEWNSKKDKRQLVINYDEQYQRFGINDHTKGYSEDVYFAYPKGNKLILPPQNSDHHSPYCEISIVNNQLVYECNNALNFTDNILKRDKFSTKIIFTKRKGK